MSCPSGYSCAFFVSFIATDLTMSTASNWFYVRFMLGYRCCKEECSSYALTWCLWTETNINFCDLQLLPRVLNPVLHSSEFLITCLHTNGRNLISTILTWQGPETWCKQPTWHRPLATFCFLQQCIKLRCYQEYLVWLHMILLFLGSHVWALPCQTHSLHGGVSEQPYGFYAFANLWHPQ